MYPTDKRGYIWFGTVYGLNRHDGYNFKVFENIPEDSSTIGTNDIICLYQDREGLIWVGTPHQHFQVINPRMPLLVFLKPWCVGCTTTIFSQNISFNCTSWIPLVGECYASYLHTEHQQGRKNSSLHKILIFSFCFSSTVSRMAVIRVLKSS